MKNIYLVNRALKHSINPLRAYSTEEAALAYCAQCENKSQYSNIQYFVEEIPFFDNDVK